MILEKIILDYDLNGVHKKIYEEYGYNEIIKTILSILDRSSDRKISNNENFSAALTFALDSFIFSDFSKKEKCNFIKILDKNNFFENISKYLYYDNYAIKHTTITCIGRFSITKNVKYLEDAYTRLYCGNDPIIMSLCLFEIRWLKSKNYSKFIDDLEKESDLINIITLGLHYDSVQYYEGIEKLFQKCKNVFQKLFLNIDYKTFFDIFGYFELFCGKIRHINNITYWNKDDYEKLIIYFVSNYFEIYANKNIDYNELYKKIFEDDLKCMTKLKVQSSK